MPVCRLVSVKILKSVGLYLALYTSLCHVNREMNESSFIRYGGSMGFIQYALHLHIQVHHICFIWISLSKVIEYNKRFVLNNFNKIPIIPLLLNMVY